ncbi:MAG: DUF192 domain-containing protein [Burkholderiaceae bacterium]
MTPDAADGIRTTACDQTRTVTLSVRHADGFVARARGLLFSAPLPPATGLVLRRTGAVHGLAMGRALDLVFIDGDQVVVGVCRLAPWRIRRHRDARTTIEFEAGTAAALGIRVGDRIAFAAAQSAHSTRTAHSSQSAQSTQTAHSTQSAQSVRWLRPRGGGSIATFVAVVGLLSPVLNGAAPSPARADRGALPLAWVERFAERAESLYRAGADQEALDAYGTLLHVDPRSASIVSLRTGNIHQRNGRHWQAIDSYRRALELDVAIEASAQDARRKALSNLATLLDAMARRVEEAIDGRSSQPGTAMSPMSRSAITATPLPGAPLAAPPAPLTWSPAAPRSSLLPSADGRPRRGGDPMPPTPDGRRAALPDGRPAGGPVPALPRVEYLGGQ